MTTGTKLASTSQSTFTKGSSASPSPRPPKVKMPGTSGTKVTGNQLVPATIAVSPVPVVSTTCTQALGAARVYTDGEGGGTGTTALIWLLETMMTGAAMTGAVRDAGLVPNLNFTSYLTGKTPAATVGVTCNGKVAGKALEACAGNTTTGPILWPKIAMISRGETAELPGRLCAGTGSNPTVPFQVAELR